MNTLIGFDWEINSSVQVQVEERERREGGLIADSGTPLSSFLQKGKQNHREWQADHLYSRETVTGQ